MNSIILSLSTFLFVLLTASCQQSSTSITKGALAKQRDTLIGGPFENRELFYAGMPGNIPWADSSPAWGNSNPLVVEGVIYGPDGRTPAPNVILYYYHTNADGYYSPGPNNSAGAKPHGNIRGWVKTDSAGRYCIYTSRPGPYPGRTDPAHIHPAILEPGASYPYYIDDFVFDDDPRLTTKERLKMKNRGGSGILRTEKKGTLEIAKRNIILGLHIPNYPRPVPAEQGSGPDIEEDIFSFTPSHVWGPDAGTQTCPVCKYGKHTGALLFLRSAEELGRWREYIRWLDKKSENAQPPFHATIVLPVNSDREQELAEQLKELGKKDSLRNLSLALVPSFIDHKTEIVFNHLDTSVQSTLLFYKQSRVVVKFVDSLPPTSFHPFSGSIPSLFPSAE